MKLFLLVIGLLLGVGQSKVLLQGFWWDFWNDNYPNAWADYLAELSPRLAEIGVDYVQGWAVARSMAPERLLTATSAADFIQEEQLLQLVRLPRKIHLSVDSSVNSSVFRSHPTNLQARSDWLASHSKLAAAGSNLAVKILCQRFQIGCKTLQIG